MSTAWPTLPKPVPPVHSRGKQDTPLEPVEKVRILHLVASNFVGGPEKQILQHALNARSPTREIWVGSFRDGTDRAEILQCAEESGLPTLEILSSGRFDPRAIFELVRGLRVKQISLLCTHGYKANVVGRLASLLSSCPQIAFVRGWTAETYRVKFYERLERLVLAQVDWVVCVSQPQAARLNRKRKTPAIVIPNATLFAGEQVRLPVDRRSARRALGLPEDAFLVGAFGRLSVEKGHRYLLDAVPVLISHIPKLRVLVLGEGREFVHLEQHRARLGIESYVVFPGFQKDVRPWMQACDVLVNPSITEGTPNVLLEATALGTPIIATSVGGVPNLVQNGESGLLVPACNSTALAERICDLFDNPAKALRLARNAQKKVREYSPAKQRERLLALYAEVLQFPKKSLEGEPGSDSSLPFISIVLPVRNEVRFIGQVLADLLNQDYPRDRYELLVVDGESEDTTREIVQGYAREYANVRLLHNPKKLSSTARNLGIRHAQGDIVAFIDGHVAIPNRSLLRSIIESFQRTGADCLARPQPLFTPCNNRLQDAIAAARHSFLGHGLDSTIYATRQGWVDPTSAGAIYRREVFDRVGVFDENFDACEDVDFNFRVKQAGLRCYLHPSLAIPYVPRESLRGLFAQMRRYGRGRAQLHRKHASALSLPQLAPFLFYAGSLVSLVGAIFSTPLATGLGVLWAIYAFAIGLTTLTQGRGLNGWQRVCMAAALPVIHLGLSIGWLEGLLAHPHTVPGSRPHSDRPRGKAGTETL